MLMVQEGGDGVMRGRWIQELGVVRMWLGLYRSRGRLRLFCSVVRKWRRMHRNPLLLLWLIERYL